MNLQIVNKKSDRVDSVQFSEEEIRAIVDEARAANRYVTGHAYTARAINRALRLGVRSIEHGNLLDDESLRLFHEFNAFLVPTLITYERITMDGLRIGMPASTLEKLDQVLDAGLAALQRASEAGVKIAFGTDLLGEMQQYQNHEFAIRARVQAPLEILKSATVVGAELLNLEKSRRHNRGRLADLLILRDNPLDDITILAQPQDSIEEIIKNGNRVIRR